MEDGPLWIVVMSATRARVLRTGLRPARSGDPGELVLRCPQRRLRAVLAGRAPPAGRDALSRDTEEFAARVVDLLAAHLAAGDFARFAVVADREMYDRVAGALPRALSVRLVAARVGDIAHLPPEALAEALAQALAGIDGPA